MVAVAGAVLLGAVLFVDGSERLGLLPAGLSLLIVGLVFFRVGRRLGNVVFSGGETLRDGRPGRGVVKRMWETGVTINQQPVLGFELDLEVEGVPAGTVEMQQLVPRMLVGAVLPGMTVAVKVARDHPSKVVIDWSELPQQAQSQAPDQPQQLQAAGVQPGQMKRADELLRKGRRGTAVLTSVTDAGEIGDLGFDVDDPELADDRLYLIEMDVKLPGRSPYPVRVGHRVPDRLIGRVGPGLEVQVAVDRADEQRAVAIDWDASLP